MQLFIIIIIIIIIIIQLNKRRINGTRPSSNPVRIRGYTNTAQLYEKHTQDKRAARRRSERADLAPR